MRIGICNFGDDVVLDVCSYANINFAFDHHLVYGREEEINGL